MTTTQSAPPVSHCRTCHQRIELLGGSWTDPDGCIACCLGDPSVAYTPHQPIPDCAEHDQVIRWDGVRAGDLVVHNGYLKLANAAYLQLLAEVGERMHIEFDGEPFPFFARPGDYTAVRRYVSEGD